MRVRVKEGDEKDKDPIVSMHYSINSNPKSHLSLISSKVPNPII